MHTNPYPSLVRGLALLLLLACSCAPALLTAQVAPEPPVGQRWVIQPRFTDEFNGSALDLNKWTDFHPRWNGRPPAAFLRSQVSVADGTMQIKNKKLDRDTMIGSQTYNIGGGAVVSKTFDAFYGYYEVRMRASRISMSSTFWMSNPNAQQPCPTFSQELDVVEAIGGATSSFGTQLRENMASNTHYFQRLCNGSTEPVSRGAKSPLPTNPADRFYRYGVWWKNGTEMDFYLDGEHVHTINRPAGFPIDREMHINMVTETYNFEPAPNATDLANDAINTTYYDYIHGLQLLDVDEVATSGGGGGGGDPDNLINNPGFETGEFTPDWIGWGGNPREVVSTNVASGDYAARIVGGGAPEQIVALEPNTDYVLGCKAHIISGQVILGIKINDASNTTLGAQPIAANAGYEDVEFTFNSGSTTDAKIYFFAPGANGPNEGFGDDFYLRKVGGDGGGGGGNDDAVSEADYFRDSIFFNSAPLPLDGATSVDVRYLYWAGIDREVNITMRDPDGDVVFNQTFPALAGYGHTKRTVDFGGELTSGVSYTIDATLIPVGGNPATDEIALTRITYTPGGISVSTNDRLAPAPRLYPNPITDRLVVENVSGHAAFRILDLRGRTLRTGSLANGTIQLGELPRGTYLLSVEGMRAARFVKQ